MKEENWRKETVFRRGDVKGMGVWPVGEVSDAEKMRCFYKTLATLPQQTHSLNVAVVSDGSELLEETDAVVCFNPDLCVGVVTADCVPVLLYAEDVSAIAAIHAGWKGTLGGIIDNTLDLLESRGASASNIIAFIGPCIHKDNYEVGPELAESFIAAGFRDFVSWPNGASGRPHLDLPGINRERLLRRGVKADNIKIHPACTYGYVSPDGATYPSHRRSGGAPARLLTYIGRLPD